MVKTFVLVAYLVFGNGEIDIIKTQWNLTESDCQIYRTSILLSLESEPAIKKAKEVLGTEAKVDCLPSEYFSKAARNTK